MNQETPAIASLEAWLDVVHSQFEEIMQHLRMANRKAYEEGNRDVTAKVLTDAQRTQQNVTGWNQQSQALLQRSEVDARLETGAVQYTQQQMRSAQSLADTALQLVQSGLSSPNVIILMSQYAEHLAYSTSQFLDGVGKGAYKAFETPVISAARVAQAIYSNPSLLAYLPENILNTITDPTEFVRSAKDALFQYGLTIASGSASEKGEVFGELISNILIGIASGEASLAAKSGLKEMAANLAGREEVFSAGRKLAQDIIYHPLLKNEVGSVGTTINEILENMLMD